MELYIIIAIISYLGFALNGVIDKFLLKAGIPEPDVFAFYIGVLGGLTIVLIPFGFAVPNMSILALAMVSGIAFVYALVAMFQSLKLADSSIALPAIAAIVPVATMIMSFFWIDDSLNLSEVLGVTFLVAGSILISRASPVKEKKTNWLYWSFLAGIFFALSFTVAKLVYLDQQFISGLIWVRVGGVAGAITLLFSPLARQRIVSISKAASKPTGLLFFAGQAIGAGASILQNYAVSLGSVVIVNALQGTQLGFLILLTWALYRWFPRVLKEDFTKVIVIKKIIAIVLISAGLIFIAR